jgi:hypothetical protein
MLDYIDSTYVRYELLLASLVLDVLIEILIMWTTYRKAEMYVGHALS